jgi:hypothetical protein
MVILGGFSVDSNSTHTDSSITFQAPFKYNMSMHAVCSVIFMSMQIKDTGVHENQRLGSPPMMLNFRQLISI